MQRKTYKPVFLSVDIEVTNLCNTCCSICPREQIEREKGTMSSYTVETIIDGLSGYKPYITISGMGDPLLHPQLPEIVDRFKAAGHNIGVVLNIASIIGCRDNKILSLIEASPNHITISIPSINPMFIRRIYNDRVTQTQIIDRVKWLREVVKNGITLRISSLITENSESDDSTLRELSEDLKIMLWLSPIHSRGGNLNESEFYKPKVVKQNAHCNLFVFHTFIDFKGRILSCCHDLKGDTEFANISDGIEEILLRKEEILRRVPPFMLCNRCDEPLRFVRLPYNLERLTYRQLFKRLRIYTGRTKK